MSGRIEIQVPEGTSRTRLEDFLFDHFPFLSRMYLREIVRDDKCEVNGRLENIGFRVRGGDLIELEADLDRQTAMRGEDIPVPMVFEDEHLVVVNKPPGMLVHPTHREKTGTLLNALTHYLNPHSNNNPGTSGFVRPGLVHRLDKQTSGLIVIAKSTRLHRMLARQFQKKQVEKKYLALVDGVLVKNEGTIEGTIGRYADEKRWGLKDDGKQSKTTFRVLESYPGKTLLELEPITGRTNQLRIHCAAIGHPIVGDVSRGGSEYGRLCLHAWKLTFQHPITRDLIELEEPIEF